MDIAESLGERRGFGVGIQVGEVELDSEVNEPFSLCLYIDPHFQVKSQSSLTLLMVAPETERFSRVAVST